MDELEYYRKFTISSTSEGLKKCLDYVSEVQKKFYLGPDKDFAFQTVLMEAVNNAINHGNKLREDLIATITISINNKEILIEVEDEGEGFNLDNIPSPLDKDHISLENGRGLFFIRSLSDNVNTRGRGNIIDIIINR